MPVLATDFVDFSARYLVPMSAAAICANFAEGLFGL
jgi:hypothetical protein